MKFLAKFFGLVFTLTISIVSVSVTAQSSRSASGEVTEKCSYPQQPSIPNGSKAEMEDMLAAQKDVKAYQTDARAFRDCIDGIMAGWDSKGGNQEEIDQKKQIAITFYNRSVSDEEEVANLFNAAIRAYKGKK